MTLYQPTYQIGWLLHRWNISWELMLSGEIFLAVLSLAPDWQRLQAGCPMTAHLGWEMQRRCAAMTMAETFRLEWCASAHCARREDFPEGVRAMLVDKDKKPRWHHAALDQVSREEVLAHLRLPAGYASHPLEDLA